jgi:hypothetical protein
LTLTINLDPANRDVGEQGWPLRVLSTFVPPRHRLGDYDGSLAQHQQIG